MNKKLKRILPILFSIIVICSLLWYLLIYDTDFTRDMLVMQARFFEANGQHTISAWLYNQAYAQSGNNEAVAIELAEQYKLGGNYSKAEATLFNALSEKPTVNLYIALCKTYVEQDKLLDAVIMLDSVQDPDMKSQLDSLRPKTPVASPKPGFYNQYVTVTVTAADGTLYLSNTKEYPTTRTPADGSGVALAAGTNTIKAVSVNELGLVSPLANLVYTVGNVVEELKIHDSSMDVVIREILGVEPDTKLISTQLWTITEFIVPEAAQSVDDLKNLSYLQKLTIDGCGAADFSAIASLTQLTELTIRNCILTSGDMEAIGQVSNLVKLTLENCSVSDISQLAHNKNLVELDLSNNTIQNLSGLSLLSQLRSLNLSHNALTNLNDLSALNALETLDVSHNSLPSVSPLAACTGLKQLNLSVNLLTSLSGLETLKNLTYLDASYNHLNDVTALAGCDALKQLDISNNKLTNISALASLVKLQNLNFSRNSVTTLPTWPAENDLVTINGSHNKLQTIASLSGYPVLNNVYMDSNRIASLKALTSCPKLVRVDVYDNPVPIADVNALKNAGVTVSYKPK